MKKFLSIILIALLSIFLISAQEYSRYGLLNYRSGLQKVANICRADSNITIVAHYKFDEASGALIDYSGNALNLTASGSPTYQQADYLSLNRAITFTPATNDYFTHADNDLFDLDVGATSYDAVIWIIAKTTDTGNYKRLWQKAGAATLYYDVGKNNSDKFWCKIKDAVAGQAYVSSSSINDGNWKLLQIVIDRSSATGLAGFINGSADGTPVNISGVSSLENTHPVHLGRNYTGDSDWDGQMAELLMIKGASGTLPDWVMSATFAANAYNWSMKWPLNLPH